VEALRYAVVRVLGVFDGRLHVGSWTCSVVLGGAGCRAETVLIARMYGYGGALLRSTGALGA